MVVGEDRSIQSPDSPSKSSKLTKQIQPPKIKRGSNEESKLLLQNQSIQSKNSNDVDDKSNGTSDLSYLSKLQSSLFFEPGK